MRRALAVLAVFHALGFWAVPSVPAQADLSGKQLFDSACAACHGANGRGNPESTVGFDTPIPDFSDCSFATREPDEDWLGIIHGGGPTRAFDRMMPAFRDALTIDEMARILGHVRTFCSDGAWPRGELNLPRPLVTEKAYPEDEAVLSVAAGVEGDTAITQKLIYEKRFGAANQVELVLPFGLQEIQPGSWRGGVGDLAIAFKRALVHNLNTGSIFSIVGEVAFPTGNRNNNLGGGTTIFEPYIAFGQALPSASFVQFQGGFEIPADRDRADEAFWRTAVGKTFAQNRFGRAWTPMVEVLAARELVSSEKTQWDVVPQLQVSLSLRQHVLFNAGVRIPVNDSQIRATQIMFYVLWDWFDGGLFSGW